ncbi:MULTISPECIES: zonular occludens toxin domain-containing protein [Pseudomonas]|uniref:zonular occludens toxin domain-containing protein n=1 Tax=Pseudomonas nitroreducens TaxID=46680 RepID=UPI001E605991|nr:MULTISPECIES: zonular occludens toxin domain-containing protein [Pseudomonas]MCE4068534.1 zonular occludens toxin domain-containing protein [Pseudomonas nitritireducens]MCE4077723.1 zonular occludens toxin domain-containing protein [Pseudomonas nitroreducens]
MQTLVTGKPGAGKTSNELWKFLHEKEYQGRPKFCTPIKGFDAQKHGVTEIADLKGWRELPEGSAIFVDEVQDYLGPRSGKEVPEWIREFARHRHYGMDFIFTTQSPLFLDPFVRKLCQRHVHYNRPWNMSKSSRRTWETVQNDPESKTAKKESQASVVSANPKVFELYTSTVLDTHKPRPPWKLIIGSCVALVLLIGGAVLAKSYLGEMEQQNKVKDSGKAESASTNPAPKESSGFSVGLGNAIGGDGVAWNLETMQPRIPGMPWTAPIYDQLTKPTDFPRIAGCIRFQTGPCRCFTQQGTPIAMGQQACLANIKEGMFDPWKSGRRQSSQQAIAQAPAQPTRLLEEPAPAPAVTVNVVPDTEYSSRPWRSKSSGGSATYVQSGGGFDYVPR